MHGNGKKDTFTVIGGHNGCMKKQAWEEVLGNRMNELIFKHAVLEPLRRKYSILSCLSGTQKEMDARSLSCEIIFEGEASR